MPERIYTNRIDGQQRIHVEINAAEICDILDDFTPAADSFDSTKELHRLLLESLAVFSPQLAETYKAADAAPTPVHAPDVEADNEQLRQRLDRIIEHRNQIEAALREVLDQFADWPAGGGLWPDGGVVAKVSPEEWDRWDAVIAPADEPGPADTTPPSEPGHATVTIAIHAPDQANADQWAETIRDLVQNEHGQHMRLNIRITPKESK